LQNVRIPSLFFPLIGPLPFEESVRHSPPTNKPGIAFQLFPGALEGVPFLFFAASFFYHGNGVDVLPPLLACQGPRKVFLGDFFAMLSVSRPEKKVVALHFSPPRPVINCPPIQDFLRANYNIFDTFRPATRWIDPERFDLSPRTIRFDAELVLLFLLPPNENFGYGSGNSFFVGKNLPSSGYLFIFGFLEDFFLFPTQVFSLPLESNLSRVRFLVKRSIFPP